MTLLTGALYDPAIAVSKDTSAAIAMTALDTTNLRRVVAVPASGRIMVRIAGTLHGATTFPQIMLGVMEAAVVKARVTPAVTINGTALATTRAHAEALFVIDGLAPGSHTLDAAYSVEVGAASTGLKYGGPNDTTSNNAYGGLAFEIWSA